MEESRGHRQANVAGKVGTVKRTMVRIRQMARNLPTGVFCVLHPLHTLGPDEQQGTCRPTDGQVGAGKTIPLPNWANIEKKNPRRGYPGARGSIEEGAATTVLPEG